MRTLYTNQYTGRKAKVGNICFDGNGRLRVFVGYCDGCKGKVVVDRDEAELLAYRYRQITNSRQLKKFLKEIEAMTIS